MSADDAFLPAGVAGVKRALQYLIREDANGDGLIEGQQHNTLDADWYGPVAWLSSLYLARLRAGEEMARETGEAAFAASAPDLRQGLAAIVERLFDGDYFVNRRTQSIPKRSTPARAAISTRYSGRAGRIKWPWAACCGEGNPRRAQSLWRYNFTPDVARTRGEQAPAAGTPCPARAAC